MDTSGLCQHCKKKCLVTDSISGNLVCFSCGVVQDCGNFLATFGGINGPEGTFVRTNDSIPTFKETKIYKAKEQIKDITSNMGFTSARTSEVERMIVEVTEGEFGMGSWFMILIGACSYIVMRMNDKPIPMSEIASYINFDLHELGRMVNRVVDFLSLGDMPKFDIVSSFERAVDNYFCDVSSEKKDKMVKQGRFLLHCAMKWFLTTGRQPIPVVVAVLVFVAELNQVEISIEDLAKEMHVGVFTSRKRHKEIKEALVKVAQVLPWGKDITVKNILHHAPFVIQYMEIKSREKPENKKDSTSFGYDMEGLIGECLTKEVEYGAEEGATTYDSRYFDREDGNGNSNVDFGDLDNLKISQDCLSRIHARFSSENAVIKAMDERGKSHRKKRKKGCIVELDKEWWTGTSDMSKKLSLKEILEKDVGFSALPPSFIAGELACKRRREKIQAAKCRIDEIMQSEPAASGDKKHGGTNVMLARKRGDMDWEDFIIETLLLHQVNEEEIEQGHYKRLLDLHVFDSESTRKIFQRKKMLPNQSC